ncbi:MAG: PHP domain-containing protein [Clostridiales bacterium]|nr:PHP domain-containing protein [Clostridiales bacterium]
MKIIGDYHTHTIYSHGKGTIEDNVKAAIEKGLKEIVISDHGPGHVFYGVNYKKLQKMRKEIDELNKKYKDKIKIYLGVEANIISVDGDIDVTEKEMKLIDKLLVGFHNGALPKSFRDFNELYIKNKLSKLNHKLKEECRKTNTQAMINAINKYKIDIITHPGAKVDIDTRELAKAASKKGTALEINASHRFLTLEYVKIAMEEGVMFSIDSDAHKPEDVGRFDWALNVAKEANLPPSRVINAQHD